MEFDPRMKIRNVAMATAVLLGSTGLAACNSDGSTDPTAHDLATACLNNELKSRALTHDIDIPGEDFNIRATYGTEYDVASWKITDTKSLKIKFEVVPDTNKTVPVVLVENLHADASIKATKEGINGMVTDSFDDRLHAGTQSGFEVTTTHPYSEEFIIGGFTENLIRGWGFMASGIGSFNMEEERLTERNLRKEGAYGQEIRMVTDLLIKSQADDPYFHKTVFGDGLIVPLEGKQCPAAPKG